MKKSIRVRMTDQEVSEDNREKNENTLNYAINKLLRCLQEEYETSFDLKRTIYIFANGENDANQALRFLDSNKDILNEAYFCPIGIAIPYLKGREDMGYDQWSTSLLERLKKTDLHYRIGCTKENIHSLAKELVDHGRGATIEDVFIGLPDDIRNN